MPCGYGVCREKGVRSSNYDSEAGTSSDLDLSHDLGFILHEVSLPPTSLLPAGVETRLCGHSLSSEVQRFTKYGSEYVIWPYSRVDFKFLGTREREVVLRGTETQGSPWNEEPYLLGSHCSWK